jgi:hypothetical protein
LLHLLRCETQAAISKVQAAAISKVQAAHHQRRPALARKIFEW